MAKLLVRRIAHDFNNLIAVVRGYSEVFESQLELNGGGRQMVVMIDRAATEMAGLADRMALYAEKAESDLGLSNLGRIIEGMVEQNGGLISDRIEHEVELGDPLPNVQGDEVRLQQACLNIWNNAVEAMPEGGEITC